MEVPSIIKVELDHCVEQGFWGVVFNSRRLARKTYGTSKRDKPTRSQIHSINTLLNQYREYLPPGWRVFVVPGSRGNTYYFMRREYETENETIDSSILDNTTTNLMHI